MSMWVPKYLLSYVGAPQITVQMVESSRVLPTKAALASIAKDIGIWEVPNYSLKELLNLADAICSGNYKVGPHKPVKLGMPPDWSVDPYHDVSWVLRMQSLYPASVLLEAYSRTQNIRYIECARILIIGWINWSKHSLMNFDYVWNDHATSERVGVFANFWLYYRDHKAYDPSVAKELLQSVSRHAAFLSKPNLFTFSGNHGFMQNMALLHLAAYFAEVVDEEHLIDTVIERLDDQFSVLISPSGMMLEHSPGYHGFAVRMVKSAMSYLDFLHRKAPNKWHHMFSRMSHIETQLKRPDGSFPPIGDTRIVQNSMLKTPGITSEMKDTLLPFAGYAIFRNTRDAASYQTQLIMPWQNFPKHSHKHADELSLYLYSNGVQWIGGPGYWPFRDRVGREYAIGWAGANAPSYDGEGSEATRLSLLLGYGSEQSIDFLDVERIGPGGFSARRQLVWLEDSILIVLDRVIAPRDHKVNSYWHTAPGLESKELSEDNAWQFIDTYSGKTSNVSIKGDPRLDVSLVSGSKSPFNGWAYSGAYHREEPQLVPTLVLEHPGPEAHFLTVWSIDGGSNSFVHSPTFTNGESAENWSATFAIGQREISVKRAVEEVVIVDHQPDSDSQYVLHVTPGPEITDQQEQYASKWNALEKKYSNKMYRLSNPGGRKITIKAITWIIVLTWVVQELVVLILLYFKRQKTVFLLRSFSSATLVAILFILIGKIQGLL